MYGAPLGQFPVMRLCLKYVVVDTDVRLEVLDWGGSGPDLLLLAGGGDTAHVFDDLAPTLAKRHRVGGVTRHPNVLTIQSRLAML